MDNSYKLIKNFINCEKFMNITNLENPITFLADYKITKNYTNKEEYIKDKNEPKELKLDLSYLDILNINYETNQTIIYNILATYCFSEKIVPIDYNYNKNNMNYQDILIYNYKNDNKLYYGIYRIYLQYLKYNSLILLINEKLEKIIKIILLNNGEDLFIFCKVMEDDEFNYIYYINNFRKEKKDKKYSIPRIDNKYYQIINNKSNICIKTNKKIILISKSNLKIIIICQKIKYII